MLHIHPNWLSPRYWARIARLCRTWGPDDAPTLVWAPLAAGVGR